MPRISIFNLLAATAAWMVVFLGASDVQAKAPPNQGLPPTTDVPAMKAPHGAHPSLTLPPRELFSHPRHAGAFAKLKVSCIQCHKFSAHPEAQDPMATPASGGQLQPFKPVCHQCHLGQVSVPRPNQCQLCHVQVEQLKPEDHYNNWKMRHGRFAQADRDSCSQCHSSQSCSECHAKRNSVLPVNHPPNFRLTHSIAARSDPQKCFLCHQSANFCVSCHTGARK